jgi:alkanesulfonate monooxygenase SsuD/methylene tetrahydromethanopterin reductase-like flavin-dependent oxidoreductase (luciferase family)
MKFGLFYNTGYYGTDPDQMIAAARHAERCGFESFYMGEHMRETARAAGRDPEALEYTRWGSIDMTEDDVAGHAANATTRLVVAPASADPTEQRDQISAFADRLIAQ